MVVLVDVRRPHQYTSGHIPRAMPIPRGPGQAAAVESLVRGASVAVFYCACKDDAAAYWWVVEMHHRGLRHCRALRGGWEGWVAAGGPVEYGEAPAAASG